MSFLFMMPLVNKMKEITKKEKVINYSEDDDFYNHRVKLQRKDSKDYEDQVGDGIGLIAVCSMGILSGITLITLGIVL